mgnify:FL=1
MVDLQKTRTGSFQFYERGNETLIIIIMKCQRVVPYVKLIHYRKIKDALLHCKRCPFAM